MAADPQTPELDRTKLSHSETYDEGPRTVANGYLFGVPVRDLGWFASILMGLATGMAAFFGATFLGIMGILIWNSMGHTADYAWSYRRFGFWAGLAVMLLALGYLAMQWTKRQVRLNR
jgi:hypothetical protein